MRRLIRWMVAVILLALVATACSQQRPAQQQQLAQTLDTLSTNVQQLQEETTHLHDSVHQLEERVNTLEAATGQLSLDAGGIGPSRAQFLPDPPDGQVIVAPNAKIVKGFPADVMPNSFDQKLSDADIQAIIEYIKTLQ